MPSASRTHPTVLLLTTPPPADMAALKASTADAIVVCLHEVPGPLEQITAVRGDSPLVILADVTEDGAHELISLGADDVLPSSATMADITRRRRPFSGRPGGRA